MTTDITALQELPAIDTAADDLAGMGLLPCSWTCWFWTCLSTCKITEAA